MQSYMHTTPAPGWVWCACILIRGAPLSGIPGALSPPRRTTTRRSTRLSLVGSSSPCRGKPYTSRVAVSMSGLCGGPVIGPDLDAFQAL
jgi:hypothetical protein